MVTFSILYSTKFSLVQIFTELPSGRSEEIFTVLNFVPTLEQDPHQSAMLKNFTVTAVFFFVATELSTKTAKFCTM